MRGVRWLIVYDPPDGPRRVVQWATHYAAAERYCEELAGTISHLRIIPNPDAVVEVLTGRTAPGASEWASLQELAAAILQDLAAVILRRGPDRVVVNEAGETTTSRRAREDYGVIPDVIFIRRDGWSLAAPAHLERVAYEMWADEWVGYIRRPSTTARPIADYPA